MLFNSLQFLLFFPVVCLVYFPLPQVLKKPWLLVCSYYFYMCWDARFALLILASTVSTWLCGFLIENAKSHRAGKLALTLNLALNLGRRTACGTACHICSPGQQRVSSLTYRPPPDTGLPHPPPGSSHT